MKFQDYQHRKLVLRPSPTITNHVTICLQPSNENIKGIY